MKLMRIKNACRDIISITPFKNNKMIAILYRTPGIGL